MLLYENILSLCKQRGISITRLSVDIGVGNSAPTKWKRGSIPRMDTLEKIADYFGVSVSFLLSSHDSPDTFKMGNVSGSSAVAQGVSGQTINVSSGGSVSSGGNSELEEELIRIFRTLDLRGQTAVMTCLYEQEERRGKL